MKDERGTTAMTPEPRLPVHPSSFRIHPSYESASHFLRNRCAMIERFSRQSTFQRNSSHFSELLRRSSLRSFSKIGLLVSLAMLAVSGAAFGAGFGLFEQGAKATAMGGAFAATADDPSAIFYNVAGIAQQRHTTFLAGGTLINFSNEFTGDPNDAFTSGATGQYKHHTFVPPNAYVIVPVGTNLTLGVGVFAPFGLRTNWEDPWLGRFVSRDANIKTVSVQPSIAWQTTDGRFALGVGAEYRRARVVLVRNSTLPPGTVNVNPFTGRFIDVASAY